jgi:tRNA threonylcarbamoyladenosine biosynthesis protein TsaB
LRSTEACSVALYLDGEVIERHEIAPRLHAEYALPWAEALLAEAGVKRSQLDAIALSRGPGAFTGVRLAIALAQGIALALDRPVVAISTLQVIAASAPPLAKAGGGWEGVESVPLNFPRVHTTPPQPSPAFAREGAKQRIVAAIDARMGEVYVGAFERHGDTWVALSNEIVCAPRAYTLPDEAGGWHAVGTGFAAVDGALASHLGAQLVSIDASVLPHAADVARLAVAAYERGEAVAPERVEPAYLRNNVALTLEEQRALRASR